MTATLAVPASMADEAVVIGAAVATRHGARLAADRLSADDFYWPAHARLFTAAVDIIDVAGEADRIAACAAQAGVPMAQVAALVAARSVMFDSTGSYARRVAEEARRRRVMSICEQAYRRIGEGGRVEAALELLRTAS